MLSQKSPIPYPLPYPPTPTSWPWFSPVLRHTTFERPRDLSFQLWLTKPSSDTLQLETRALGVLVSSYCCSTYRFADPCSSLGSSRMWRRRNTPLLFVGLQACTTTLEISLVLPQKIGHSITGGSYNTFPGHVSRRCSKW